MFKNLCLICICAIGLGSSYVLRESNLPNVPFAPLHDPLNEAADDLWSKWGPHIMEFVELIDLGKVLAAALPHLNDPEVVNFVGFLTSPKFKQLIGELEATSEFKEAVAFLKSKGYSVEPIIELINSLLGAPVPQDPVTVRGGTGVSGLLADVIAVLPLNEMKQLLQHKIETIPEITELYNTLHSEEFIAILGKMKTNPKFIEFKQILESYGFDFEYYCKISKNFSCKYYQSLLCGSV